MPGREAPQRAPSALPRRVPGIALVGLVVIAVLLLVSPAGAADRDDDGLHDAFEARWGFTDPATPDSDADGVIDAAEDGDGDRLGNLGEQRFGTNPGDRDSDADGRPDGSEDHDRDGRSDSEEQDQRPVPSGLRPTLREAAEDAWLPESACVVGMAGATARRCRLGDPGAAISLAVVGDSKAAMLMPAFIGASEQEGWRIVTLLKGACSPVLGTMNSQAHAFDRGKACRHWRRETLGWLRAYPPGLIVYVHSDDYRLVDGRGMTVSGLRKVTTWRTGMARTIAALPATSRVMLLGDVPRNQGNPVRCLRAHRDDMSACVAPRQAMPERIIEVALREAARGGGAQFGTLYDKVCSYDPCPLVQGDTLMWRDSRHLSVTFARRLVPAMRALLAEALASTP